jgi:L-alanine-DL-glutamate epimerase-like enolase superfamily enzyme
MPHRTDVQIREVEQRTTRVAYRTPLKFGGVPSTHATLLDVRVRVETVAGRSAWGTASMPMGHVWAFPSTRVSTTQTERAMVRLAERIGQRLAKSDDAGHPIELAHRFGPDARRLAGEVTCDLALDEPMPALATLVAASAFDLAVHDAYGRVHDRHVYDCYGAEWLASDLSSFLDERFRGERLDAYVRRRPKPRLPLYHLVGALDPLTDDAVGDRLEDGLPNTLGEWIERDGLTHLKVKLNGNDAAWDIDRIVSVDRVAAGTAGRAFTYSLDFNERCPDVGYLLDVLCRVRDSRPQGFERIAYVEQPTARDLDAHPENRVHEAAALKPVVIDESLVDYASLLRARELGYSGVALKACKGQSSSLLLAAAAQKFGMFLCVQDLTCPGQAFLASAGLAAHIDPVAAIEGNARQYCPLANALWALRYPGAFTVREGQIETSGLDGVGLI